MRSRRRTTQWNLFFHYAAIALATVSGVVLVPLYLKYIPLNLYGAWLATGNVLAWITAVDPGLSTVLQQRVGAAFGRNDTREIQVLLSNGLVLAVLIALVVLLAGLAATNQVGNWVNLEAPADQAAIQKAFWLAVLGTIAMIFSYPVTAINQGLQGSLGIGLVYVTVTAGSIALTILLLFAGHGVLAIPAGVLVRGMGLAAGNLGYLVWRMHRSRLRLSASLRELPGLLGLLSFTSLSSAATTVASNAEAFVVARLLGPESTPPLVLARKAPEIAQWAVARPAIAFMPAIAHVVGAGELDKARDALLRLLRITAWLLGIMFGGFLTFNQDFIRLWVGAGLYPGDPVNLAICLAFPVTVASYVLRNLCVALGNIRGTSIASAIESLLRVLLMMWGARSLGLFGVAAAPLLAVLAVSTWYLPSSFSTLLKLSPQDRWEAVREAAYALAAAVPPMLAFSLVDATNWIEFGSYVAGFAGCYTATLLLLSRPCRWETRLVLRRIQTVVAGRI